jgi:hypothetical protein
MSVWIDHVKKVQKEKGITYKEAMVEAKKTYKKPMKQTTTPQPELHQRKEIEKEKPKYEKAKKLIKETTPEAHKVVKELVGGKMTKLLVEDQGGLAHIYPLHHDKVLKLYS